MPKIFNLGFKILPHTGMGLMRRRRTEASDQGKSTKTARDCGLLDINFLRPWHIFDVGSMWNAPWSAYRTDTERYYKPIDN